jgi:hypothetical protein
VALADEEPDKEPALEVTGAVFVLAGHPGRVLLF